MTQSNSLHPYFHDVVVSNIYIYIYYIMCHYYYVYKPPLLYLDVSYEQI